MSNTPEKVGLPMLGITSEPLPMPPEMFSLIGEIVVLWSRIETTVDHDITTMLQWRIVRNLQKKRPRGFRKKVEFWRRAVRTLFPKIEVYQSYADEFERAVGIVAKARNHVIHGTWSLTPTADGVFTVHNIRSGMEGATVDTLHIDIGFLRALLNDMRKLDDYITGFVASKMLHAHQGLLKADRGPSPPDQARSNPPKPHKPQRPRRSSPR